MDYQNTLKYLYESTPMFQQIGGKAYKPGLETTHKLDEHLGHPHQQFRTIHIAGTNGKGSCSHTIAAVLQAAGYKVGLFTSPHLIDFRERIRINGEMIPEDYVVAFVEEHRSFFEPLHPFFLRTHHSNGIPLLCRPEGRCSCNRSRYGRTSGLYQYHPPPICVSLPISVGTTSNIWVTH